MFVNASKEFKSYCKPPQSNSKSAKPCHQKQHKKAVCEGLQQPPSVCAVSLGNNSTAVADFTHKNWDCRNEITVAACTKKAYKSYKTGCFLKWNLLKKQPVLYTIISEGYFTTAPKYLLFFKWGKVDTMFVNASKEFKSYCKPPQSNSKSAKPCHQKQHKKAVCGSLQQPPSVCAVSLRTASHLTLIAFDRLIGIMGVAAKARTPKSTDCMENPALIGGVKHFNHNQYDIDIEGICT